MIRYSGFADLVDRMVASAPERTALRCCDNDDGAVQAITWAELARRIAQRADELSGRDCGCEAILADGSAECVVEVFAAVHAGLQVALVDPVMPNRVLQPLLHAVDADYVWASDPTRLAELEGELAPQRKPAFGAQGVLFFTSGTTSSAKPVVLTDGSLMASAFNGASLLPLSPDDTLLCLLPLSHVFGFVCGLLWGLSCGAAVALGRGARYYIDDLTAFSPTAIAVVPRLLEYLIAREALCESLDLILVGAADCPDETLNTVRKRGIRTSLGYGLTETSSGIALSLDDDFHAMTICPDDEVAIGDGGEILVSAPTCLMQGYYRDEVKTAASVRDGVLHTGDTGYLDDAGRLHVTGRLKDVLTLPNGTKVFLPEYEAIIAAALSERDVAVVLCDEKLTLACGMLAHGRSDRQIATALETPLSAYPPASRIAHIAHLGHALPRTAAGKVERWKIQEELEHGNR